MTMRVLQFFFQNKYVFRWNQKICKQWLLFGESPKGSVRADWVSCEHSSEFEEDGKKHKTLISVQSTKFTAKTSALDRTFWSKTGLCASICKRFIDI